eukprot:gene9312-1677_t
MAEAIPLFRTPASEDPYDHGYSHGVQARALIQVRNSTLGQQAFARLKQDNNLAFPDIARNIQGIAHGAQVQEDYVWMMNLVEELGNIKDPVSGPERCSDIYASSTSAVWLGHNEDWSEEIRPFVYFVVENVPANANITSCAGFSYPAMIPGSCLTFNPHGIVYTQNMLFPQAIRHGGLGSNFVNRQACKAQRAEDVVRSMAVHGQAMGFSLNVVSSHESVSFNMEVHQDQSHVHRVPHGGNFSHFNMYKTMSPVPDQRNDTSTIHRQARVDQLPPSATGADIVSRLGDTTDPDWPIYRPITLITALVQ